MSRFDRLLKECNNIISRGIVRHPTIFKNAIHELRDMIGNVKIKESIADQIMYIVSCQSKNDPDDEQVMLNTLLYGPPGVGKTRIGIILSKIWYSLGFLKREKPKIATQSSPDGMGEIGKILGSQTSQQAIFWTLLILLILIQIASAVFPTCLSCYSFMVDTVGTTWSLILLGVLLAIIIVGTAYAFGTSDDPTGSGGSSAGPSGPSGDRPIKKKVVEPNVSEYITVVSREDFVDKYVGWTDKKTLELLNANVGKVLFIDEAYSLSSGYNDSFGMEALTVINRFMSEHPGKIIIIMAGYKHLMKSKIFALQPGLARRFMWHFDCKGYSIDELYQIFELKCKKLKFDDKSECKKIFFEHKKSFPNFGGDVERLCFLCKLEMFGNPVITPDILKRALDRLKDNNIDGDGDGSGGGGGDAEGALGDPLSSIIDRIKEL